MKKPGKSHLTHEELLIILDGEMSDSRVLKAREHLADCPACCERLADIRTAAADFARAHLQDFSLPLAGESREVLKARVAELSGKSRWVSWPDSATSLFPGPRAVWVIAAMLLAALGLQLMVHHVLPGNSSGTSAASASGPLLPEPDLTPGATRPIDVSQVCRPGPRDQMASIPIAERRAVFHEYGMDHSQPRAFEVDHLITPELGGTDDIRNLWPEPYASTEWNAHVKDELEDRLRELVCSGNLDLPTAQHDMATNWIAAYKKYFHTETPLLRNSDTKENRLPTG